MRLYKRRGHVCPQNSDHFSGKFLGIFVEHIFKLIACIAATTAAPANMLCIP